LMTDQSRIFDPRMSRDIRAAISSPASEDGSSPSRCPDTPDLFGQDHAPANPSPQQEKAKHQAMNATSGPNGSGLSEQFDRQSSLANKLKRQLDGAGSTLFTLTWRKKATPLGRPYYQLVASGRRTSDNDCGSWPTPRASGTENLETQEKRETRTGGLELSAVAQTASWATPTLSDQFGEREEDGKRSIGLNSQAGLTSSGSPAQTESKGQRASWHTPDTMPDAPNKGSNCKNVTPGLGNQAGANQGKGQLNPSFSLWLMGYPQEWLSCAPLATRSSRKSRQSS
jgi:hypothetical protein